MRDLVELLARLMIGLIRPVAFILVKNYRWDFLEKMEGVPRWTIPFHLMREWVFLLSGLLFAKAFMSLVIFFSPG